MAVTVKHCTSCLHVLFRADDSDVIEFHLILKKMSHFASTESGTDRCLQRVRAYGLFSSRSGHIEPNMNGRFGEQRPALQTLGIKTAWLGCPQGKLSGISVLIASHTLLYLGDWGFASPRLPHNVGGECYTCRIPSYKCPARAPPDPTCQVSLFFDTCSKKILRHPKTYQPLHE